MLPIPSASYCIPNTEVMPKLAVEQRLYFLLQSACFSIRSFTDEKLGLQLDEATAKGFAVPVQVDSDYHLHRFHHCQVILLVPAQAWSFVLQLLFYMCILGS